MKYMWDDEAYDRVIARAKVDLFYQEMLNQCIDAEKAYIRIMEKLPAEEREQVDDYIALCENMQYRKTQLAYELGTEER